MNLYAFMNQVALEGAPFWLCHLMESAFQTNVP